MEYGAIDLHKLRSQIRVLAEDGAIALDAKIATTRGEFTRVWGARARMRILIESSTESEWVAQHLEALGHEATVVDPNYLPMYGSRSRKVKTDRRDVAALAEACRTGTYRRAHRASAEAQALRQTLRIRRQFVRCRSGQISLLRSLLRQEGLRLGSGGAESVVARLAALEMPAAVAARLTPLQTAIGQLTQLIRAADATLHARASTDVIAQHLMSAPGVGPIVALTYRAVLDDPARFGGDVRRASAYLGLVPSEDSSAERRHKGHITRTGPRELRALLVQASWVIWRSKSADGAALRTWAHALAGRRGRRIAVVALARRLSRILLALWRDRTDFQGRPVPTA